MLTRAKAKQIANTIEDCCESSSESSCDSEYSSIASNMEDAEETVEAQQVITNDHIAALVESITSLREFVTELRNDSLQVRPQVGDSSANAAAIDNAASNITTSTQTPASTEFQPHFTSMPPLMTQMSTSTDFQPNFSTTSPRMMPMPAPTASQYQFMSMPPPLTQLPASTEPQPQFSAMPPSMMPMPAPTASQHQFMSMPPPLTQLPASTEPQPQFSAMPPSMMPMPAPTASQHQFMSMPPPLTQLPASTEPQSQFLAMPPRMMPMPAPTASQHQFMSMPPYRTQTPAPTQPQFNSTQLPQRNMNTPINNTTSLTFMDNSAAKLFPLPTFDGNPEDWPLFLANYNDTTVEFQYSHRQNLMRLHKALQGAAKSAVTSLLIYPEDVPNVIRELEFNFGRPELLIKSQLQKVQRFPSINESQLDQILDFANRVRNIVAFFKSARCGHHLMNPTLLETLVGKLPPSKQYEWSQRAVSVLPYPTVEHFSEWLSNIARFVSLLPGVSDLSLRNIQASVNQSTPTTQPRNLSRQSTGTTRRFLYNNDIQPEQMNNCLECGQTHKLAECPKFSSRDIQSKWSFVKSHHLCFGCLCKGHGLSNCSRSKACLVNGCKRMHHTSLHQDTIQQQGTTQASTENVEHVLNCLFENQKSIFKIFPITLSGPNGSISAYAMFDEGSSITLLEDDIAVKLGLRGPKVPLTLQWYGESQSKENARKVSVNIRGESEEFNLRNVHTVKSLNLPQQTFDKNKFAHFLSLPIMSYINAKPVILLGIDNSYLGIAQKVVDAGPEQPIAIETRLGWVAYGPISQNNVSQPHVLCIRVSQSQSLNALHKLVNEYFSVESFGVRSTDVVLESDENRRAREILQKSTKFLGQKYEIGLLWRKDNTELPPSYDMALQRLRKLETRMTKDASYAASYKREMQKYVDKGYARLLAPEDASRTNSATWYLPHFGVVNPHKPSKLRIVFDAAAATSNVSLNTALLKGPEHAQPLLKIIFKFRQGVVAVAADVQEMFSQVAVKPEDQNSQRFLWRDGDPNKPIQIYAMCSMIFGAVCSPCCAEYVKNVNAIKFEADMPRGSSAVINNMYVDDLVISFESITEAEEVVKEAIVINSAAGFTLRNFVSNNKSLQAVFNENSITDKTVDMEPKSAVDKVLGMFWNTSTDCFEFHLRFHKIKPEVLHCARPPTKRELLGIVMAIYDPFGFLANMTICMKILMQSLWKRQTEWDELIPEQLISQWTSWWECFQNISSVSIPRCYSTLLPEADEVQLHVFVDASSSAYAAVAYLRVCKNGVVDTTFVAAKSRCAPLKGMTIPRLELQAAVLGSRLQKSIVECHDFKIHRIVLWSDSKTVLLWIRSTTREYKQFVAGRIAEIISATKPSQWRWLPTSLNVADDATRGQHMIKPDSQSRWLQGPTFMRLPESEWPQEVVPLQSTECAAEEKKCLLLSSTTDKYIINFSKFSSFWKLLRVMSWVLRFIFNVRNRTRRSGELKSSEIIESETYICRRVQEEVFASELEQLRTSQKVSKSSPLYSLTPFLDTDGIMKINGRIDAAYCLPLSARRPVIMPQNHHVTRLLVLYWHKKLHHQNDSLTINEIRQKFWVPHIRTVLASVKKCCPICIISSAKPSTPLMGQLPVDRLTPFVRPFSYTGVDYCGPFFITIGRRREKRWVALFTCLTIRAIHLEVAEDLSTDSFIICFRNFINRRGTPVRMRSDNGTNFVGAQKLLRVEDRLFDFDRIDQECAERGIDWLFNCPANPAAGGCWERLVQCVKRLLERVLKEEAPRLETFRSTLIEAENIINSRPLTDIPVSPHDEEPLTPNHFLLGCMNSTQTPNADEESLCTRKQWRIAQSLKDRLWKRWTREYLPSLICRPKWREQVEPLRPGQLVIVCEPNLPRSKWVKGRVKEVFVAKDGQVRSALVQTSSGEFRRPAAKLAALKICESQ